MKRFWISENFRGEGFWVESPNIAKAVERFGEEAVAISFRERGREYTLILYPDAKFHITTAGVKIEVQYEAQIRKWIYAEGEHHFPLTISRETISALLNHAREMLHK